jgi:hypothetical protein
VVGTVINCVDREEIIESCKKKKERQMISNLDGRFLWGLGFTLLFDV